MYRIQNNEAHQPQTGWQFGDNMYYVCIEDNAVTSILSYKPEVPRGIEVVEISDENMGLLEGGKYTFDIGSKSVVLKPASELQAEADAKANVQHLEFLRSTDWKVLRHTREKALGISTTLSDAEYLALEQERENAAKAVR